MFRQISLVVFLAVASRGTPIDSRIAGGSDADIADFPYSVSIESWDNGHYCGGAIINTDWVLTDASCTPNPTELEEWTIRVGNSVADDGERHSVLEWVFHPLADVFVNRYDFALVKVDPPFVFGATIDAVALPAQDEGTPGGANGTISGWGGKSAGGDFATRQLQAADLILFTDNECTSLFGENHNDAVLCAQAANKDVSVCWSDEGGPLVVDEVLFGVILWPFPCSKPEEIQKFARVAKVRDWINATAGV